MRQPATSSPNLSSPSPGMKTCTGCREAKPAGDYYQNNPYETCKACQRVYSRARGRRLWRESPKERARQKARVRKRPWTIKDRAKKRVGSAIATGRLVAAKACERCGHDFSESRREGHHADYSKPLEVEWLCQDCHSKHHWVN